MPTPEAIGSAMSLVLVLGDRIAGVTGVAGDAGLQMDRALRTLLRIATLGSIWNVNGFIYRVQKGFWKILWNTDCNIFRVMLKTKWTKLETNILLLNSWKKTFFCSKKFQKYHFNFAIIRKLLKNLKHHNDEMLCICSTATQLTFYNINILL